MYDATVSQRSEVGSFFHVVFLLAEMMADSALAQSYWLLQHIAKVIVGEASDREFLFPLWLFLAFAVSDLLIQNFFVLQLFFSLAVLFLLDGFLILFYLIFDGTPLQFFDCPQLCSLIVWLPLKLFIFFWVARLLMFTLFLCVFEVLVESFLGFLYLSFWLVDLHISRLLPTPLPRCDLHL